MYINKNEKIIVVVGLFATGKTTVCNEIVKFNPDIKVYHTDDFLEYDKKLQLRFLMNKVALDKPQRYIIEGAPAYFLLKNGFKDRSFMPDVVIHCVATDGTRQQRYLQPDRWYQGRHSKANKTGLKDFKAFDNMYRNCWEEYNLLLEHSRLLYRPRIIQHVTEPQNLN